ncbi:MAG: YwiC-like family protein, partial [Anaerolineae bacterium]
MRLRAIAIPAEHGSWGFLLEPIFLGLLVAPSLAGIYLSLAVVAVLFTRQPMRIAWVDRRRGKRYDRTAMAERFTLLYGAIALLGVGASIQAAGLTPLVPLLFASPFLLVFLIHDVRRQSRAWPAELAGPVALAAVATSVAVAGGWAVAPALVLWVVLAARAVPAVLYVRARLRLGRGEASSRGVALAAHVAGLALVVGLVWVGLLPALAVLPFVVLLARAVWLLSPSAP